MAKLPEHIREIAKKHDIPANAFWDCHGTWVCYHKDLEAAAARAGVKWTAPQIIESDSAKAVSILATGSLGEHTEWSVGEASPKNNKNAYPWAMAEKRAKDRVILKLLGFAGNVYSEEEADDFKASAPRGEVSPIDAKGKTNREIKAEYNRIKTPLDQCSALEDLKDWSEMFGDALAELPEDYKNSLRGEYARKREEIKAKEPA